MRACEGLVDRVGREAAEGTVFHDHAELALRFGLEAHDFTRGIVQIVSGHEVSYNEEMVEHLQKGLDYVRELLADPFEKPHVYIEEKVKIQKYTGEKNGFGTSDICIVFVKQRKIIVFDWKYGKVAVSPVENDQEELYGLGCWESFAGELFDWDSTGIDVEFVIWQPRIPGGGGSWHTTMDWLLEEGERIRRDADATRDPNAPRIAGTKQCQYCRAASTCAALAKYNLEMFSVRFDEIDDNIDYGMPFVPPTDPDFWEWTPERRSYVLLHWKVFKRWHDQLSADARRDAVSGRPVPFMKMVDGRAGNRVFPQKHVPEVQRFLIREIGEDKAMPRTLLSVPEAEAVLGKKRLKEALGDFIFQPPGKPVLVPETDKRPAKMTHGEQYDQIDDDPVDEDEE